MNSDKPVPRATGPQSYPAALARVSPWLLIAICLAVVLVFVSLGAYAHPSTDDFCMADGIRRDGLIRHLWNHYLNWSGRYSGNALYGVYPIIFGMFEGHRFIPVIVIVSLFAAGAFLLSSVFGSKITDRCVLLSALCFVCVYLLGMISPASGLYWMAGALSYQPANVLLLVALGLMLRLMDRQKRSENYAVPFVLLLAVMALATGFNETGMIALVAIAALFPGLHLRQNLRLGRATVWSWAIPWVVVFVTTLVCAGIVFFSPGNAARAAAFPLRHDLPRALGGSLDVGLRVLGIWLGNPALLASTLLAPFAVSRLYRSSGRAFAVSKTRLAVTGLCTLAVPCVFQFPAWWAMGGWAPARAIDAAWFVFLLGWFLTTGAITVYFRREAGPGPSSRTRVRYADLALLAATVLFTLAVLGSDGYRRARSDLVARAGPWDAYMQQRYALIGDAVASGRQSLSAR